MLLTAEERKKWNQKKICHICKKGFKNGEIKHIDHSHISG